MILDNIEERFAAAARTPKGRKALRAVFRATRQAVAEIGLDSASLDAIAGRAGLTQAALRHYFPTRDELLTRFFATATGWLQEQIAETLEGKGVPARQQLERCVAWHIEFMESVDTVHWLEASSYWLRKRPHRRVRDDWYRWLLQRYAQLIGQIQPRLGKPECQRRAYLVLTLVLGAWVTHGRGSALGRAGQVSERRQLLINAAMSIATGQNAPSQPAG